MLVQAAVGAALAMFLREWYLEDLNKRRKLQAAEQQAAQNEEDEERKKETENENNKKTETPDSTPKTENETTQPQNTQQNEAPQQPGKNNTAEINSEPPPAEIPQLQTITDPAPVSIPAEIEIDDNIEADPVPVDVQVADNEFAGNEIVETDNGNENKIEQNDNMTENKEDQPEYKVDEIISNMLSDTISDVPSDFAEQIDYLAASENPTSIFDLPFDPTQFDPQLDPLFDQTQTTTHEQQNPLGLPPNQNQNNTNPENNYKNENNTVDNFEAEFDEAANASDENNKIDFVNLPNEYENSNATATPQNISQTAAEILGENFDFNSLLAVAKVVDNSETEPPTITPPESNNNPNEQNLTNILESIVPPQQTADFFAGEFTETTSAFAPDLIQKNDVHAEDNSLNFTEFPPPVYKRKNKKK
jgi:hypothetical protein